MNNAQALSTTIKKLRDAFEATLTAANQAVDSGEQQALLDEAQFINGRIFIYETFHADLVAGQSQIASPSAADVQSITAHLQTLSAAIADLQAKNAMLSAINAALKAAAEIESNLRKRQTA